MDHRIGVETRLGYLARDILPSVPEGFARPNDALRFDPRPHLDGVPDEQALRGLFFNSVIDMADSHGVTLAGARRYVDFKHYPIREWMELCLEAARLCYPQLPLRGGLRRLGQLAYPCFASSMVGRVIFGILGDDTPRIMSILSKGYDVSVTGINMIILACDEHSVRARFEKTYGFIDSFQVGVFEGVLDVCKRPGEVYVRVDSVCEGEIFARWV